MKQNSYRESLNKESVDGNIRRILLRNFDNDRYLWSVAHKELIDFINQNYIPKAEVEKAIKSLKVENPRTKREESIWDIKDMCLEEIKELLLTHLNLCKVEPKLGKKE